MEAAEKDMELSGVLKIGTQFFLKIGKVSIDLEKVSLLEAVGYLLVFHYILDLNYPAFLFNVYIFLEALFNLPMSKKSLQAKRLLSVVFNKEGESV